MNFTPEDIRILRFQTGMTQKQFAAAIGVTREAVNLWENGKREPRTGYCRLELLKLYESVHFGLTSIA